MQRQSLNYSKSSHSQIIGRFAPSPTGSLHLGSLVAAVASYMIAKQPQGQWLVRIEDIDRPREVAGAATQILKTLEDFGLHWDGEVVYQSQRNNLYQAVFEELIQTQLVYQCDCSRKMIESRSGGIYDGFCRHLNKPLSDGIASRLKFLTGFDTFNDYVFGQCRFDSDIDKQDFVIKRRDGLFAYQLAVVVDDIEQGVNQVVRGADILESTPRQNFLYHCLAKRPPTYYHLPLVLDQQGKKVSKRFKGQRIEKQRATELLIQAFQHLGQAVDKQMNEATPGELITYFLQHWKIDKLISKHKQTVCVRKNK